MAYVTGTRFSDTDTGNVPVDMSGTLDMLDTSEVPLLQLIGKDSLSAPCVSVKHEWLEKTLRPLDSLIATQGGFSSDTGNVTNVVVTAGDGKLFSVSDIVKVDDELLIVTGVSTDTLSMTRAYGGSTGGVHTTTTVISIIGSVALQDAAVPTGQSTVMANRFNYTQIYNAGLAVTSTALAIQRYVEQDLLAEELRDELKLAWKQYERTLLYGRKVAPTASTAGAMDGILPLLTTNSYAKGGAAFTEAFLLTALRDVWRAGGSITHVVMNDFQKTRCNQFLDAMRITSKEDRSAGVTVDNFHSEFGNVTFLLDRNMPNDTVLGINKGRIGFGPLRNHTLRVVDIAQTTGLVTTKQLIGQYTAELHNENSHFKITGLSTS
jgi:Family of unknown function (DUF5309)